MKQGSSSSGSLAAQAHAVAACNPTAPQTFHVTIPGGTHKLTHCSHGNELDGKEMFPSMDRDCVFTALQKFHEVLVHRRGKRGKEIS